MPISDVQIEEALQKQEIAITVFDPDMLQPASYDLKAGKFAATVPTNGDPRINLEKEGMLLIPPYAPAVIFTMEELKLSKSYVGRFGLKSKLARRGVTASVGLQIDPGFHGPLSVTLFNHTPTPVTLNYGEDFLSMELEKLSVPASRGYTGEYQDRKNFTSRELDPVIGFKGHALTDVVKGFADVKDAVLGVAEMSQNSIRSCDNIAMKSGRCSSLIIN
jgi:dCTP deaminase